MPFNNIYTKVQENTQQVTFVFISLCEGAAYHKYPATFAVPDHSNTSPTRAQKVTERYKHW